MKTLRQYSVVTASLGTVEGLPVLVDADTGLPLRLALRWILYQRRFEVAENTLRADLYSLRTLYQWGNREFAGGIEERIAGTGPLTHEELLRLNAYLREPEAPRSAISELRSTPADPGPPSSAVGHRALIAMAFLKWAIVPASRNERGAPPTDAEALVRQIEAVLRPTARLAGRAVRIPPLPDGTDEVVDKALAPRTGTNGVYARPLQFRRDNPFRRSTRLRNWLLWTLMRDCGLRLGESLALRADDFPDVSGHKCVRVVRRPDAEADPRGRRPQAKTLGRVVPLSDRTHSALRAYLTERPPMGRRMGSPYLFMSTAGRPLGIASATDVVKRLRSAGLLPLECSWHSLRHTWAEEVAAHLFAQDGDQHLVIDKLRMLGGWSPTSSTPAYYAQLAIGAQARKDLSDLQRRYADRISAARS